MVLALIIFAFLIITIVFPGPSGLAYGAVLAGVGTIAAVIVLTVALTRRSS